MGIYKGLNIIEAIPITLGLIGIWIGLFAMVIGSMLEGNIIMLTISFGLTVLFKMTLKVV